VDESAVHLDRVFFALSDPVRREIVRQLAAGPRRVGALELPKRLSAPAVAKHLRVLQSAGVLTQQVQGRMRICSLVSNPIVAARGWMQSLGPDTPSGDGRVRSTADARHPAPPVRSRNRAVLERVFGLA